eukprot:CAMPEP_0115326586 /NCGR_PEP_ID=MMETSP0270-20121206/83654_1 /TAXON_ID=71861 /ORGANISM="Scrippsiella trochoidea, Strain CCMP3099" /LENGTH=79 /DNA_ID=CAMNT_0002746907 /DNA_START=360 /DNA_END=599 /DNA_ORIENTATION=+
MLQPEVTPSALPSGAAVLVSSAGKFRYDFASCASSLPRRALPSGNVGNTNGGILSKLLCAAFFHRPMKSERATSSTLLC